MRAMKHSTGFLELVNKAKSKIKETNVSEVVKKIEAGHAFHFVDVREDDEWKAGHAKGAIHLGKGILERDVEATIPNKEEEIILYCGGGFRSALAAESLQQMGYTNVISMDGGIRAWREAGLPQETSA